MIKVGQEVTFDPYAEMHSYSMARLHDMVTGKVIYVHPTHRYFTAEYETAGTKFKISFNFKDLREPNKTVYIVH